MNDNLHERQVTAVTLTNKRLSLIKNPLFKNNRFEDFRHWSVAIRIKLYFYLESKIVRCKLYEFVIMKLVFKKPL